MKGMNGMITYKCPNCGRMYNYDEDGWYDCMNCGYPLKRAEEVKKVRNPYVPKVIGEVSTPSKNQPKCPTCGSTNIQKISATSKIGGAFMFGWFSKTARSQFKCNNCGYKW